MRTRSYSKDSKMKAAKLFNKEKSTFYLPSGAKATDVIFQLYLLFEPTATHFKLSTYKRGRCLSRVKAEENPYFYGQWTADDKTLVIILK